MAEKKKLNLTEDNIAHCLIYLALPIIGASILGRAFYFINGIWVGRLGAEALAVISAGGFILSLFWALNNVVVIGTTVLVAQSVGAKKEQEAIRISQQAVFLSSLLSLVLLIVMFCWSGLILKWLGLGDNIVLTGSAYLRTMVLFIFLGNTAEIFGAILVGYGDTKTPNIIFALTILFNLVLDPLLIFGFSFIPKLGLLGSAWATNITVIVKFLIFLFFIWRGKIYLTAKISEGLTFSLPLTKQILKIGFPASVSFIVYYLVYSILTKITGYFGTASVASLGIGYRVETLSIIIFFSFYVAVMTMVGQNKGAGKIKRAEESVLIAAKITSVISIFVSLLFILVPQQLALLFTKDPQVVKITSSYIFIIAFSQIFMAVLLVVEGAFAGAGNTIPPMIVSLFLTPLRLVLGYVFAVNLKWGINGVWWALTITTLAECLALSWWFSKGRWKV